MMCQLETWKVSFLQRLDSLDGNQRKIPNHGPGSLRGLNIHLNFRIGWVLIFREQILQIGFG
jgi:hypothetical protein